MDETSKNNENVKLCIGDANTSTYYQEPIDIYSEEEPIDIYSEEGTKVIYTGNGGLDYNKKHANKYLKVGEIYTIDYTDVGCWYTSVYLKEVPNQAFNSVHFVNAK